MLLNIARRLLGGNQHLTLSQVVPMTEISGGGDRTVHISPFIIEEELKTGVDQTENTPDTKIYTDPFEMSDCEEINIFELKDRLQKSREYWNVEHKKKCSDAQGKDESQTDPKPLDQESKWRQIFETTFKRLCNQRSDKEGQKRRRSQATSEYLSVTTENVDDETMRQNAAVIPCLYTSGNNDVPATSLTEKSIVHHSVAEKEKQRIRNFEASWSDQDIAKFKSRLSVVGKNFANIAKFFADKTVKDCVECYYLIIKRYNLDYKNFVPKPMQTRKYRPPPLPTAAALAVYQQNSNSDISLYGFTNAARCYKCQQVLDTNKDSMRVTRGLVDAESDDIRDTNVQKICGNCYNEEIKRRVEQQHAKLKKPGKILASRWKKLNTGQKTLLRHEIARDMTFACSACNKKLLERVDLLFFNHNNDGDICCQRHYPGGNQLKLTSGVPLNHILLENIDKFLYDIWHSQKVRGYKVPKRSQIAVSFPYAKVLNENDVDVLFEHCLNFVRLYEPECGSLPAIDLVSTVIFPEVILRSIMMERNIGHDDAYMILTTEDGGPEIKRPRHNGCYVYNENNGKIEFIDNQEAVDSDPEAMIDIETL